MGAKRSVTCVIANLSEGGAERALSILANNLEKCGVSVNIILIRNDKIDYPLNKNINVFLGAFYSRNSIIRKLGRLLKLRKYLKMIDSDTVLSFSEEMNFYTVLADIGYRNRLIIAQRNAPIAFNKLFFYIQNLLLLKADGVVFQTEEAQKAYLKIIQKKSLIIQNYILANLPVPYHGERDKRVVMITRLVKEQKNLKMALMAFRNFTLKCNDYILELYGEGTYQAELERMCKELGISKKVKFKGFQKNVHEQVLTAGMFISSSDYEGISNSMIEAMAIGLPCICTDCPAGGARGVIRDGENGFLVPVNNWKSMSKKMQLIADNEKLQRAISFNASNILQTISPEKITELWESILWK